MNYSSFKLDKGVCERGGCISIEEVRCDRGEERLKKMTIFDNCVSSHKAKVMIVIAVTLIGPCSHDELVKFLLVKLLY